MSTQQVLGHVIALDPTFKQANALARAAGVSRFSYNWALTEWDRQYKLGGRPTANKLKKQFNMIKGKEFPWIYESPKDANQQVFKDLDFAFSNFFKSIKGQRKGPKIGYPTKRKKGQDDSFYVSNDKFHFDPDGKHVVLPVIGSVKTHESLRFQGKIVCGRVRRIANKWYLSVQVECESRVPNTFKRDIIGVDLGIKTAIFPSQEDPIESPKPLKKNLKKLAHANRRLHRRQKGGQNRFKARMKVARIHQRIANIRKDFMHKVTTKLARENQTVVIEDLNVREMLKNERLARAISDVGFGMFRRFLEYKAPKYGGQMIAADRWYPSSKRCSQCEYIKEELTLKKRVYRCEVCGFVDNRDHNAAKNLEEYPRLVGNSWLSPQTLGDEYASTSEMKQVRSKELVERLEKNQELNS